ncbi:hypothetical protein HanRHA438_Chr15g0696651 [Helianthus annuus]|nr:hypothetical protein HanRHA438_Chr15g0696651 [Helianthus annuus]
MHCIRIFYPHSYFFISSFQFSSSFLIVISSYFMLNCTFQGNEMNRLTKGYTWLK